MNLKVLFVIATVGLFAGIVFTTVQAQKDPPMTPLRNPSVNPYKHSLAGLGIVEAYRENINIAPYWPGKIVDIYVKEGDLVQKGQPIYKLDTTDLEARYNSLLSSADATLARLEKLKNEPRKENVPPLEAAVKQAEANYKNIEAQYNKMKSVVDPRAVSLNDLDSKKYELEAAKAQWEKSKSDLVQLKAGAWEYDIKQAKAEHKSYLASAEEIKTKIDQGTITAPRDGEILKIYQRIGEYASAGSQTVPVLFGSTKQMQVRVDIDEENASKVKPDMKARANLKGDSDKSFSLKFLRIQPYMVPKQNLSGLSTERVDVRVLQVIYRFQPPEFPVYVGQQVDVFLDDGVN